MARSDRPDCAMIWYEGALRDHLALDASADRPLDGTTTASGFVQGQEGAPAARSIRRCAPASCASSWASSAARRR